MFYQAPLYPYFLGVLYALVGDGVLAVRLVQAAIGATSCALLARAGISLLGHGGAIAGLALAVYPPAIVIDALLEKSVLATFFTTALIAAMATTRSDANPRLERFVAIGGILGLLALTRENALLLVVPVLLWILLRATGAARRARMRVSLAFALGLSLVLLPVGLRNLAVGGEFHVTTSQFGPNFYIGNHAGATGTYESLVVGHGSAADERADATRVAEQSEGRTLSPAEVSRFWRRRAIADIASQPAGWVRLVGRKIALTFNADEIADTESHDVYAEASSLLRALQWFDFGTLFALAAFAAALAPSSWRRLWWVYALSATYAASVVLFYVFARYRFPLVPLLALIAAAGVLEVRDRLRARRFASLGIGAAAAMAAFAFARLPLENIQIARAVHYAGLATAVAKDPGRYEEARLLYGRALSESPGAPAPQFGLATLLVRMGRSEEAIPYFRAALASWPDHAEGHYNFGVALASAGRPREAADEYREAVRLRPDDIDAHVALGVALAKSDRTDEAVQSLRRALEIEPANAAAHNTLGWILATAGRPNEAIPHFERAVALNPADENAKRNLERARGIGK